MKAQLMELKQKPDKILEAIEREETITLSRGDREIARIVPIHRGKTMHPTEHPAFGIWKDRKDMEDPAETVAKMRKPRFDTV